MRSTTGEENVQGTWDSGAKQDLRFPPFIILSLNENG